MTATARSSWSTARQACRVFKTTAKGSTLVSTVAKATQFYAFAVHGTKFSDLAAVGRAATTPPAMAARTSAR